MLDVLVAALSGTYAHLVAKRAAYAVDPVQDAGRLVTEWRAAVEALRAVVTPDPGGDATQPNYGATFAERDYAAVPHADLPFGVPPWLDDDAAGRQARPKRRNTVERDPKDLMHTLIWQAPPSE